MRRSTPWPSSPFLGEPLPTVQPGFMLSLLVLLKLSLCLTPPFGAPGGGFRPERVIGRPDPGDDYMSEGNIKCESTV